MFEEYKLLLIPFIALIIAQLLKVVIQSIVEKKFSWKAFNQYGGFPSAHMAMVISMITEIGLVFGLKSGLFAVGAVVAFLIFRDATGFRKALGNHAKFLNKLVVDLPDYKENKYPYLEETLGHTYTQAFAGAVLGMIIALVLI